MAISFIETGMCVIEDCFAIFYLIPYWGWYLSFCSNIPRILRKIESKKLKLLSYTSPWLCIALYIYTAVAASQTR